MMTYDLTKAHQAQLLREAKQAHLIEAFKHTKATVRVQRQWYRFFLIRRALVVLMDKIEMLETRKVQNERQSRY